MVAGGKLSKSMEKARVRGTNTELIEPRRSTFEDHDQSKDQKRANTRARKILPEIERVAERKSSE